MIFARRTTRFARVSKREKHMPGKFILVVSALMMTAVASATDAPPVQHTRTCAGESCEAVLRGFFAFFDRAPHGLDGNGRSCADCHMPSDQFQLSPAVAEARFQLLQKRRRINTGRTIRYSGRSMPMISASTATRRAISQLARERPGACGLHAANEFPPDRSGHHLPSPETAVDIWRMVRPSTM